jgi:serine/threonine-protein kinase
MPAESHSVFERLGAHLADRYRLSNELGRGGMATVYLAHDIKHERLVAIKVLHPDLTGGVAAERVLREIQTSARLTHPHIMPLIDSGRAGDLLYYVMPRIEGETLRDHLGQVGPLPVDEALHIAGEIADGLAYAHGAGLVHRDIKPENILLSSGHAVITDFGIAHALDEAGDARLTRTGTVTGTPAYMSPEQWEGRSTLDGRSDQYSLACLVFEMLTGTRPYTGPSTTAVMAGHIQGAVPSVREARPDVLESIDAAIRRAMAKSPADRFPTTSAFAVALGAPGVQLSSRPLRALWLRATRGRRRVGALAVAIAMAIAGFAIFPALVDAGPRRLAVLPFENLGQAEDEYFADGVSEEITNRLAGLSDLAVIARTSSIQYRGSSLSRREIANDLGVDYLIEGSVQWNHMSSARGSVKIIAKLVEASDERIVWAIDTTAALTDVFGIQASIADRVAQQFNLAMLDTERQRLTIQHTDNLDAYDAYLRGNAAYERSWAQADVESALTYYRTATELDPSFALAWAKLARTHAWMHQLRYDLGEDRLIAAKSAADRAVALDADLAEAHIAMGLYWYWGRDNYQRAIDDFTRAGTLQPSNAQVFLQIGNVRRRQGEFDASIASYRRSAELNPRSHNAWFNLGETQLFTRQYDEAGQHLERVTELAPEFLEGWVQRARLAISANNDTDEARRMIRSAEDLIPPTAWRAPMLDFARVVYEGDRLDWFLDMLRPGAHGLDSATYHLMKARMLLPTDPRGAAFAQFDSARVHFERMRDEQPGQAWIHGLLGAAYAGVGRADEAVRAAERAMQMLPVSNDALDGPEWVVNMGTVHVMLEDMDRAAEYFDMALAVPSWFSLSWLRIDPALEAFEQTRQFRDLERKWSRQRVTGLADTVTARIGP